MSVGKSLEILSLVNSVMNIYVKYPLLNVWNI